MANRTARRHGAGGTVFSLKRVLGKDFRDDHKRNRNRDGRRGFHSTKCQQRKRTFDDRAREAEYLSSGPPDTAEITEDFVLAPLVDKIAYGIAQGLVAAVKELEQHIACETRKVADAVDRRLDTFQVSMQDLAKFVGEQRSTNAEVQDQLQQLALSGAGLRETDARHAVELETVRAQTLEFSTALSQRIDVSNTSLKEADARHISDLEALRTETRAASTSVSERLDVAVATLHASDARQVETLAALQSEAKALSQSFSERLDSLCKELGVHQEDIADSKSTLGTLYSRVDVLVERLDRQADAVRSMYTAYSQRETELEQLVDGLARLRVFPTPLASNAL